MKILLPIDDSQGTQQTLHWASRFLDPACARVYLLYVVYWSVDALVHEEEVEQARNVLFSARRLMENRGFSIAAADYVLGSPSAAICKYADENDMDEIIIGSHGHRGLTQVFLGSVSRGVFQCATQPVLLLNNTVQPTLEISHPADLKLAQAVTRPQSVLLPVDDSDGSQRTLAWAVGFLNKDLAELHLLNVYDFTPEGGYRTPSAKESQTILNRAQTYLEKNGFRVVHRESLLGTPPTVICDYADEKNIDLIVLGAHGHHTLADKLMGSVSSGVLRCAHQPVVVLNNEKNRLKMSQPYRTHFAQGEC